MRFRPLTAATALAIAAAGLLVPGATTADAAAPHRSAYVRSVLSDHPSALLQARRDLTGRGPVGPLIRGATTTRMPNGDRALRFNGHGQFLRFWSRPAFKITTTGALTVEYWMRPDTLQFPDQEGSGYVYVLGKGNPNHHEWYTRMYSKRNAESRPNRISGYSFNPQGGLGAGSYAQDRVTAGRWIHVVFVVNSHRSRRYPMGYTRLYKNGVLRDTDSLKDYNIRPRSGSAPLRIGTGYGGSYFQGAVGDISFFNRALSPTRVRAHYNAMR